jgi:heme-degrading monooxygenase HmoA
VAERQQSQHAISLFRFRMRDLTSDQQEEYNNTAERLLKMASAMPGFISFRNYSSDDGEMLVVVEFASAEAAAAWRDHPDHRTAQQHGRERFYAEYQAINCAVIHRYGYKQP